MNGLLDNVIDAPPSSGNPYREGGLLGFVGNMNPLDKAALMTMPVPLLGDVIGAAADVRMFMQEPESRTPLNFGLAGLGMLPFVPALSISKKMPIDELSKTIKNKYGLDDFFAYTKGNAGDTIKLDMIKVPKGKRKMGIGTDAMNDLIKYADDNNKRIVLTPGLKDDISGTTSRNRLVKFYKKFGFIENKGRNKDFTISEGMYRDPSK